MEARNGFTVQVSHKPFLPVDDDEIQAVLTVTARGTAPPAGPPRHAEVIVVDCSGSMGVPATKISAARRATVAALRDLPDGTLFAVVQGAERARMVYPAHKRLAEASPRTRAEAIAAVQHLDSSGGTAMHTWLARARRLLAGSTADIRHVILLTDGHNRAAQTALEEEVERCVGVFSCDPTGIGEDWEPRDLLMIARRLGGRARAHADGGAAELEADFTAVTRAVMAKRVPAVRLVVRTLAHVEVGFLRQMFPTRVELTPERISPDGCTVEYNLGAWGEELREYLISLRFPKTGMPGRSAGIRQRLARVDLWAGRSAGESPDVSAPIAVEWTDDPRRSTVINPQVSHHVTQLELNALVEIGYAAYRDGDKGNAARYWARALKLAAEVGNAELRRRLQEALYFDGDVPRLRENVRLIDSKLLNVASNVFIPSSSAASTPGRPAPPPARRCPECGRPVAADARRCTGCETRLDDDPESV
ncbi:MULTISPECIES: vWA domain-containing protein [Thermomonospora]|uniref:von Willebrand factor type A n=1 Tax=Thermomonospora curvata (strain ATCC 19995 / DSM 43183 / JCM 3096 / KCTC 9072 / NBRC 15933 / NCIMB 10081 / Henssen B9) TaxID=471852 RepID=D1A2I0_THECD|nr:MULTISPECIES: VWA domain-containing protein [Thermomonospora]ACY96000.1 von Willebrand factor type A [Thermomonospora curvata DSM 43183]PKK16034.1 MAG: VWA domain-containing protein [Thermomonospora sp. CIF 1]